MRSSLRWGLVVFLVGLGCQEMGPGSAPGAASGGVGAGGSSGPASPAGGAGGSAATGGHAGVGGGGSSGAGGTAGTAPPASGGSLGSSNLDAGITPAGDARDASGAGGGPGTPAPDAAAGAALRIYWIDAEGGAATLLIAPSGETLLADTGWAGPRDVDRIVAVLDKETGQRRLDYFLATHYHEDHVGGAPDLAKAVQIANFIDHGSSVEQGPEFDLYRGAVMAAMGGAKRITVQPGSKITLGGVEITIVAAAGNVAQLPSAAPNPACAGATITVDEPDEDPQSVGFVARWGSFDFVALGDLTAGVEHKLACPSNQLGAIDLFQASQHGSIESNALQLIRGLAPQVVVFNNGADKGGDGPIFQRIKTAPGIKDVWSLHRKSRNSDAQNADPALIANDTGPDMGHFIRASVNRDGSFTVTNGRSNLSRSYSAR